MANISQRPYRKRKRARAEEETRRRITEAAVELHGTVGPARTTMTEVAELAGVSRMTVYNHFPTEADLFVACSTHWATENPFPDPSGWVEADVSVRLQVSLEELYGWYRQKEGMLGKVLRDTPAVPALGPLMDELWEGYMESVVGALAEGWPLEADGPDTLHVLLRVAADFGTWQLLTKPGTDDTRAAALAARMVTGALDGGGR
jgi:AcrR family transcriptional regulator